MATFVAMYARDEGAPLELLMDSARAVSCDGMEEARNEAKRMKMYGDVKIFKLTEIEFHQRAIFSGNEEP
jgi:hypothetical protein